MEPARLKSFQMYLAVLIIRTPIERNSHIFYCIKQIDTLFSSTSVDS